MQNIEKITKTKKFEKYKNLTIKDEYYTQFIRERNLKKSTSKQYLKILTLYCNSQDLSVSELIAEADYEEENRVRNKNKTLTRRLKEYRTYLVENYQSLTVQEYFGKIKSFYRHFEIEVPYIPPIQLRKEYHERYDDIPRIEHIKEALEHTNNLLLRALILFMASSGTARVETLNLTIQGFIDATNDYHNSRDIISVCDELTEQEDIIPIFEMTRQKTNYPYYTCCSPEAVTAIIRYLRGRENIQGIDNLFDVASGTLSKLFNRLNDRIGWGKINKHNFFHPHALRKFHATVIEDTGLANALQGRKADSVSESYFKHNPKRLREKYLDHLDKLTVNPVKVTRVDDEGTQRIHELEKALEQERLARLSFEERLENLILSGEKEIKEVDIKKKI
ncbi:MAG: integrase [Methanobrevibacter sp.]|jgi:integrase|nr:integrase [Candidatus Methanovirga australis]